MCVFCWNQTDPQTTDYILEAGATRNFEASRTAEKMALQEQKEKEAEEANNPMKVDCRSYDNNFCCWQRSSDSEFKL